MTRALTQLTKLLLPQYTGRAAGFQSAALCRWAAAINLHPIDLRGLANAKNLPRVMRRKIAAAVVLQSRSHDAAGRPVDSRANRVAIAFHALQLQPSQ